MALQGPEDADWPAQDMYDRLRMERLLQITVAVVLGLVFSGIFYVLAGVWTIAICIGLALLSMLLTLFLGRSGRVQSAAAVFIASLTSMIFAMLWLGEGLADTVLLGFPALLAMGGLLLTSRSYWALVSSVVLGVVALWYAEDVLMLRQQGFVSTLAVRLRDLLTLLGVSAAVIWLVQRDWLRSMAELRWQVERYKTSQQELTYLSEHDSLTGLFNRLTGAARVADALAAARVQHAKVALLFVDLDHFKNINDTLGHSVGDDFLREIAQRLRTHLPGDHVIARHGGDEFVVALVGLPGRLDVDGLATQLLRALSAPVRLRHQEIPSSCSVGVAVFPDDAQDYETLLRQADIAMYEAKQAGRNAYRFYMPAMQEHLQQHMRIATGLRQALSRGELLLYYQPVVSVGAEREILGVEALLRWQHPELGLIAPGQFIDVAEKTGLIMEIGAWVLLEACRQAQLWRAQGFPDLRTAVNLSPIQLQRGNIEAVVLDALEQAGLPSHCLELEITESMLMDNTDSVARSLSYLRAKGVHIAIDDFGTGYSNLAYLRQFSVNKLKIDQSFVRALAGDASQQALVKAIIQMTKSLGLLSHAEGVEHESQHALLQALDCDLAQGYWYGRPMSAQAFEQYLRQQWAVPA